MSGLSVFKFAGIIRSRRVIPAWRLRIYGDLPAYPLLLGLLRVSGGNVSHEAVASVLFLPLALIALFPRIWVAPAVLEFSHRQDGSRGTAGSCAPC